MSAQRYLTELQLFKNLKFLNLASQLVFLIEKYRLLVFNFLSSRFREGTKGKHWDKNIACLACLQKRYLTELLPGIMCNWEYWGENIKIRILLVCSLYKDIWQPTRKSTLHLKIKTSLVKLCLDFELVTFSLDIIIFCKFSLINALYPSYIRSLGRQGKKTIWKLTFDLTQLCSQCVPCVWEESHIKRF